MVKTKVVIASHNPVKITYAKQSFITAFPEREFTFEVVSVSSHVQNQPMTGKETLVGALHIFRN